MAAPKGFGSFAAAGSDANWVIGSAVSPYGLHGYGESTSAGTKVTAFAADAPWCGIGWGGGSYPVSTGRGTADGQACAPGCGAGGGYGIDLCEVFSYGLSGCGDTSSKGGLGLPNHEFVAGGNGAGRCIHGGGSSIPELALGANDEVQS